MRPAANAAYRFGQTAMICLIPIRMQISRKALQEPACADASSARLVIIKYNRPQSIAGCPVEPYIAALPCLPLRLPQHHERRLIRMQDLVCKKLLVQRVIYRQEPAFSGGKNPVGHGLPGNGQTKPVQLLLLPVKRKRKHIFAVHDLRQQAGRNDPAARQKRRRNGAFLHGNTGFRSFALTAAVRCLDMLCELVLCGDICQFPPQNAVSAGVQFSAALRAAALLLRQFVQDLFYRKTGKIRFPLSAALFPPAENGCF